MGNKNSSIQGDNSDSKTQKRDKSTFEFQFKGYFLIYNLLNIVCIFALEQPIFQHRLIKFVHIVQI